MEPESGVYLRDKFRKKGGDQFASTNMTRTDYFGEETLSLLKEKKKRGEDLETTLSRVFSHPNLTTAGPILPNVSIRPNESLDLTKTIGDVARPKDNLGASIPSIPSLP